MLFGFARGYKILNSPQQNLKQVFKIVQTIGSSGTNP